MSPELYLTSIAMPFVTILLVFGMRYASAAYAAKARLANDDAYRRVAEAAVAAEAGCNTALAGLQTALGDVRARLASIEKILKEVE